MSLEYTYGNISNLFVRLIGYINLILQFDSYKEDHDEYKKILDFIYKCAVQYEIKRNLDFIDNNELVSIYEKADDLQTKYICNFKMGSESEFSDFVLNLLWDLRIFYKKSLNKELT